MYDAIIVGARCAGSTTAMLLARKGYRVLMVDRARFPSDTMSTHWVHQPAIRRLRDWGVLDSVQESGCPAINGMVFDLGPFALRGSPMPADGVTTSFAPRRTILDSVLVNAAAAAGAEVRESFSVHELIRDDDGAVVGIRGGASSATVERGRITIGADGLHSLVARAVQAPLYDDRPPLACAYYAYWSGLPTEGVEIYVRPGASWGLIPTNDGLTCLVLGWPHERFHEYRADIEGSMLGTITEFAPELRERIAAAHRETRYIGTADVPNYYRRPYGRGWALVGDAGYHKDPCTAQGISDAFRDAELLTQALDAGWSHQIDLAAALGGYEAARNAASHPIYEFTCQLATMEAPSPPMQAMFAALQTDPEGTSRFFGVIAGTVSPSEFFGEHP
ncbi:MAG: NAD(P)/FAD-dependent oxidoreductase [Actinomycetota bacterium]|nr:NAD(P)/FAD-dependent oxidoreductase [Actinomycetota bacterium]